MSQLLETELQDFDITINQILFDYDKTVMPVPDIEFEPHLLISKVRKHYMEHIIKLLSINYESNQRLNNKNLRLPSAIWRCAKNIEMTAAQTCMVVQIYRKNIVAVIKQLKQDTKKGKLYKTLYDYVKTPPENEKKVQTLFTMSNVSSCQCTCNQKRKRRYESESPESKKNVNKSTTNIVTSTKQLNQHKISSEPLLQIDGKNDKTAYTENHYSNLPPIVTAETQGSDDLLRQLEILFKEDHNDDDIFEQSLCSVPNSSNEKTDKNIKEITEKGSEIQNENLIKNPDQSFDERLATFAGQLVKNNDNITTKPSVQKNKRMSNKWLCEEYFLKSQLFEILDQLRDCNRAKFSRVKGILQDLFGEDSDDEGVMSPLEETQEFITSCKERIAPWVVKVLTPFYIKGHIKGKVLFKSVAKHLIRLIYQCSKYPSEFEVKTFVNDFLESHKNIRCEADFKQFRIENFS
ncbi:uncharacterized protein [Battus philenor]|uniref:uncharacterized protein n=1 Tax=Battus philenor TaxID=42288 RepID=UPI0035D10516